jgi:hypothetical protein
MTTISRVECDYCGLSRLPSVEAADGWLRVSVAVTKTTAQMLDYSGLRLAHSDLEIDVCFRCAPRVSDLRMMLKRGMAASA